jgi:hypothetical protein
VTKQRILEAVREICLDPPETSERPSHGAPTFFIRGSSSKRRAAAHVREKPEVGLEPTTA